MTSWILKAKYLHATFIGITNKLLNMIKFKNICQDKPYLIFKDLYNRSIEAGQKNIEAICISSFSSETNEINARFVNIKFIERREFIFFSNYSSPKASEFLSHDQISGTFFWSNTNIQIRMKAFINQKNRDFNKKYFYQRDINKNALAISSDQSKKIDSYEKVLDNYKKTLKEKNLRQCPENWGGFAFKPYYFEFWEGHKSRLNKRDVYEHKKGSWVYSRLQP